MRWTAIDRRAFLAGVTATLAGTVVPRSVAAGAGSFENPDEPVFVSARREADGSHAVVVTDLDGMDRAVIPLPARGHDIAQCPSTGRCMAFARRPGTFAVLFDPLSVQAPMTIVAQPGRHFYGHGTFSPDGRLAYATENDYAMARGIIGIYDVSGSHPRRIGEFDSGGTGPHDMLLMPDGRTLVVANGGIATHPDTGRVKLNLATMRANIALIDRVTGDLVTRVPAPDALRQLSLRHMDVARDGIVWIGGQHQGAAEEAPPLIASFDPRSDRLSFHDVPARLSGQLENYVGSVSLNRTGTIVAASCPRAGRVLYFSATDGRFLAEQRRNDACGLAPLGEVGFAISDGTGGLLESQDPAAPPSLIAARAGVAWDNHLVALRTG